MNNYWYGNHLRKIGWCELCEKNVMRKMSCILKHKCKKDKLNCIFHLDTPLAALNNHKKADKHRWRKDIVIGPGFYEPKEQDIDRPCGTCGWNVHICEPHYKGNNFVVQKGINTLEYHAPPAKPQFEDYYDSVKPLKKDYEPGGKYMKGKPKTTIAKSEGEELYKSDLDDYMEELESFEREIDEWKIDMSMHTYYRLEAYSSVNHYHQWCKNEQ